KREARCRARATLFSRRLRFSTRGSRPWTWRPPSQYSTNRAEVPTDHLGVDRRRLLEPIIPPVGSAHRVGRPLRGGIPPDLGKGRMAVAVLRIEKTRERERLRCLPHGLPQVVDVLELKVDVRFGADVAVAPIHEHPVELAHLPEIRLVIMKILVAGKA